VYCRHQLPELTDLKKVRSAQRKLAEKLRTLQTYIDSDVKLKTELVGRIPPEKGGAVEEHIVKLSLNLKNYCDVKIVDRMYSSGNIYRIDGVNIAFIGDGNNVANSLILLSTRLGANFSIASPKGYEIKEEILEIAKKEAERSGSRILITDDPMEAAKDADVIYTDVWASMGQESEKEERKRIFSSYQVNMELVRGAKDDVIVMHCLPAHRGEEITDEVIDSPYSVVIQQAENRLHAQKAILALVL